MSMETVYNIVFNGRTLPGIPIEKGMDNLAKLTRKKPEELKYLFDGRPRILKRNVSKEAAIKYSHTLKNAGLDCQVAKAVSSSESVPPEKKSMAPSLPSQKNTPAQTNETDPVTASPDSTDSLMEYVKGTIILSLLLIAAACFAPNARSPILAGFLLALIFLLSYPCVLFIRKILHNSITMIILVSLLFGGGPLVFFMCYGIVKGFSGLFNVKRFFKIYLIVSCVLALGTCIFLPHSMHNKTGKFTDPRDGKTYKTIQIGDQVWMAENLAYKSGEGYYSMGDLPVYGYLYTFEAALEACPDGWHLPSDEEWMTLINHLGGQNIAGKKLKSRKKWEPYFNKNYGNNQSGFSALPSGFKDPYKAGKWDREIKAYFFSDTPKLYILYYSSVNVGILGASPSSSYGYSVRCVRDEQEVY